MRSRTFRTLVLSLLALTGMATAGNAADRPNILLILTDNTGWGDWGAYGGGELRGAPSPRIDRLASEGMTLLNFNTEPQCTPSRSALKDPTHANLDRVQIVKGWIRTDGTTAEKVYDVVWGDGNTRRIGEDGRLTPVGNTVDVETATWKDSIGAAQLHAVWADPDFDPARPAFYYLRVLAIPTPRWVLRDAVRYGVQLPEEVPVVHQERAYSSPIWYIPASVRDTGSAG